MTAPTAPPLRGTAPAAAPASTTTTTTPAPTTPAPTVLDPNEIAAAIAASTDPAAFLTHVVLAVAARSATAPEQGVLLGKVQAGCTDMIKRVRVALLAAVDSTPGAYDGFEVTARAGSRSVDYSRLQDEYPDVYGEVVNVGAPTLVIRYANAE